MFNPLNTLRKFQSRLGKPIRPIVELQKGGSIVNIITNTIQVENMIQDTYRSEAWELHPEVPASAIYVDGLFKGMGFFVGEEGHVLNPDGDTKKATGQVMQINKEVELFNEVLDENQRPVIDPATEQPKLVKIMNMTFKGINGKLLDAGIIERGSALKPSMGQTLVYCALVGITAFLMGMVYQ